MTSNTTNTLLIEAVEKHPCLYDINANEYSNRDKCQEAWDQIAKKINCSVKECKESWRNLRIVFTRNIKLPPSGSKAKKKKWPFLDNMMFLKPYVNVKPQKLYSNLPSPSSLLQSAEDQSTDNNETESGQELTNPDESPTQDNAADEIPSCSSSAAFNHSKKQSTERGMGPPAKIKKKKNAPTTDADQIVVDYIKSKSGTTNENNPKRQFLLSLLPDVEEMNSSQFRNFRTETSNLIDRILGSQPPTPSPQSPWMIDSSPSSISQQSVHVPLFISTMTQD